MKKTQVPIMLARVLYELGLQVKLIKQIGVPLWTGFTSLSLVGCFSFGRIIQNQVLQISFPNIIHVMNEFLRMMWKRDELIIIVRCLLEQGFMF